MNSLLLFIVAVVVSSLTYVLIAWWYVVPRLATLPRDSAIMLLLLFHPFRTIGLIFIVPQVTGSSLPPEFAIPAAFGDLLAVGLSLLALVALRTRAKMALPLLWIFNLEGTIDLLFAVVMGAIIQFPNHQVGPAWFIPTIFVPWLLVTHALIFWLLTRPQRSSYVKAISQEGVLQQ